MIIGVAKEICPEDRRVAMVPMLVPSLTKAGHQVVIEQGAGLRSGYRDNEFLNSGAEIEKERARIFEKAEVLFMVRGPGADPLTCTEDMALLRPHHFLIAFLNPLMFPESAQKLAATGVTAFSLDLIPRIFRAQSMDALSSMASLAGYKGVLIAANALPKIFPLMMTAAGSLMPAKVFVIGAGVTGLQACATAKRMGALVSAYDVRPAVKDQVTSVGAEFVEFDLDARDAEDTRGYAKAQSDDFYRRQREEMTKVLADSDVVLCTAGVPGKKAPVLITEEMVSHMKSGSVIVDLMAELGGNCELTRPGETIEKDGIVIIGPENISSSVAFHASQMLAKNIITLFDHLVDMDGRLIVNPKEEITWNTLLCRDGTVTNHRVLEQLSETPQA
jgi:H+-translocating NAD(P) transhydrogenase subunit alpha